MTSSLRRVVAICGASLTFVSIALVWSASSADAATVTANPDTATVNAGAFVDTDVRANDTVSSGTLALPTVQTPPAHGSASVNADGTIRYAPAARFSGADSYIYKVCDMSTPTPDCGTATVTVTVDNVFIDGLAGAVAVPHDIPVTLPVSAIVTTVGEPIDPKSVTATALPIHGTVGINPVTGAVTYSPTFRSTGLDSIQLLICDISPAPNTQCHSVTIAFNVAANTVVAKDLTITTGVDIPTPPIDILAVTTTGSVNTPLDPASVTVPPQGTVGGPQNGTTTIDPATGKIVYTPDPGFIGTDSFQYTVCDTSTPAPICDTKTITVNVTPISDVAATKVLDQPTLVAGAPFSYTVAVSNLGPADAPNVHSIDPIASVLLNPVGTPDPSVAGATCTTRPTTSADLAQLSPALGPYSIATTPLVVDCTYPTLTSGVTAHDTISGTVDPALLPGSKVVNQAPTFSDNFDPNLANNLAIVTNTSTASADLQLTKTADQTDVVTGDSVTFTVTVVNKGPSDAGNFVVSDTPTGLTLQSENASAGGYDASTGLWTVPGIKVGQTVTLTLVETVDAVGAQNVAVIANSATPDPNPSNNGGSNCTPGQAGCGLVQLTVTTLAATGAPAGPLTLIGLLLLVVGGSAVAIGRRRA